MRNTATKREIRAYGARKAIAWMTEFKARDFSKKMKKLSNRGLPSRDNSDVLLCSRIGDVPTISATEQRPVACNFERQSRGERVSLSNESSRCAPLALSSGSRLGTLCRSDPSASCVHPVAKRGGRRVICEGFGREVDIIALPTDRTQVPLRDSQFSQMRNRVK